MATTFWDLLVCSVLPIAPLVTPPQLVRIAPTASISTSPLAPPAILSAKHVFQSQIAVLASLATIWILLSIYALLVLKTVQNAQILQLVKDASMASSSMVLFVPPVQIVVQSVLLWFPARHVPMVFIMSL